MSVTSIDRKALREKMAKVMEWESLHVDYFDTEYETPRQKELEQWLEDVGCSSVGDFWIDVDADFWMFQEDWDPLTNLNQAFMLVEVMNKKGFKMILRSPSIAEPDKISVGFTKTVWPKNHSRHSNPATAICLAIEAMMDAQE